MRETAVALYYTYMYSYVPGTVCYKKLKYTAVVRSKNSSTLT